MEFLKYLRCPITNNNLLLVNKEEFSFNKLHEHFHTFGYLDSGLIDSSKNYFYPIFNDIIILHEQHALFLGKGEDIRTELSFDKKRVFDYYNEVNFKMKDSLKMYGDSSKWVDFRDITSNYIKTCFKRASRLLPLRGKYLLDIASGPIGSPEYMALSDDFEFRICADISINALIQAKNNMEIVGKKGIYLCGDITNIPIKDNSCDAVLCQHTLYHIPKYDQFTAINEMYRVAKLNSKIVIIYCWFYHSWFMNISLNIIQLYRILRHLAGKAYVRLAKSKPRLYFYSHSPGWFKKSFSFSKDIEFYCWRSTNKYFLRLYIHKWLFGSEILKQLMRIENKYSKFMGIFGAYPAILITKK